MFVEEQAKIRSLWKIQVRRADTEEIIREQIIKNVVTDSGKQFCAECLGGQCVTGQSQRWYWYLVLGTGSGTPSATDTGLWSPVDASAKHGSITVSGNICQYYVRYLPEDANGYTYTEAGIYDKVPYDSQGNPGDYTQGILLNHVVISPSINKTSDILVDFYVQIQFS